MFFKNNFQPAYATANASFSRSERSARSESVMFSADNEEFNAFDSTPNYNSSNAQKRPQQRPQQKASGAQASRKNNNSTKSIIIAVAAIAVLIAIIAIGVVIVSSMNKDIKFKDNSFVTYSDEDGNYSVVANGKVLQTFGNEIELIVADDRSFAYVIEDEIDGVRIHIATNKDIVAVTSSPVTDVLATASLKPGVIYEDEDGVYLYTSKNGDEGRITRDSGYSNWLISADASTVVYTAPIESNAVEFYLCVYKDNSEYKQTKNLTPVAVSADGSLIYGYGYTSNDITSRVLYVINSDEDGRKVFVDDNFGGITAMNAEGNEIIYYTNETKGITSYIYAFNEKKIDEAAPSSITRGIYAPVSVDPEIAIFGTFADCYLEGVSDVSLTSGITSSTYYIDKNFSIKKVASATGKFSPDGEYLYYISEGGALMQLDLSDDNYNTEKIAEDIVDFEVTQKGNVYHLSDGNRLRFYKLSSDKTTRISDDAEEIVMYDCGNVLYFTETENVNVFSSKEGSSAETVKFDSTSVTGIPVFSNAGSDKTYVAFEDTDSGDWKLFYTSNGSKFKMVDNSCVEIDGMSDFDWDLNLGGSNDNDSDKDEDTAETTGTNN